MLTLEELIELELSVQDAIWDNYERTKRDNPELLIFIHEPAPKRTAEQIRAKALGDAYAMSHFSMRTVVTGARRNWKRGT